MQRVKDEEGRDMSELVREALRLYLEERELRREARLERLRSRQANQSEEDGGQSDEKAERRDAGGPVRPGVQRPPGRGPIRGRPTAGAAGLRRQERHLVVREYIDEAESGRIADRPQFRKMLDEASKSEAPFREILVWNVKGGGKVDHVGGSAG